MSTRGLSPRLADNLRLLAASQLQIQAARSAAIAASALGVMAVDAGVAAIVVDATGAYDLWIAALVLLGLSLALAVRTLRLPGAERTGPSVADILDARDLRDEASLGNSLLSDLAEDIETNGHALVCMDPLFDRAGRLLVFATLVELLGPALQ